MELREEGRFVSLGQDPLLHHRTFNIVILDHHVFLQDLDGVQLLCWLHLRQHHLRSTKDRKTQWVKGHDETSRLMNFCATPVFSALTLPKLPFPSRARKLKSLSRTRSMLPEGRLNRRWSDGVITFLPWPSLAFCGIKVKRSIQHFNVSVMSYMNNNKSNMIVTLFAQLCSVLRQSDCNVNEIINAMSAVSSYLSWGDDDRVISGRHAGV